MNKLLFPILGGLMLVNASCSLDQESDGRKYHSNISPIQGKMGVTFHRTPVTTVAADGTTTTVVDESPGLFDRNEVPDEPGAEYWMHGQHSPDPIQGKMGVRVSRRKK